MRSFSNIDIEIKNISIFKTNDFFLYNTFNMCPCFAKAPLTCANTWIILRRNLMSRRLCSTVAEGSAPIFAIVKEWK